MFNKEYLSIYLSIKQFCLYLEGTLKMTFILLVFFFAVLDLIGRPTFVLWLEYFSRNKGIYLLQLYSTLNISK